VGAELELAFLEHIIGVNAWIVKCFDCTIHRDRLQAGQGHKMRVGDPTYKWKREDTISGQRDKNCWREAASCVCRLEMTKNIRSFSSLPGGPDRHAYPSWQQLNRLWFILLWTIRRNLKWNLLVDSTAVNDVNRVGRCVFVIAGCNDVVISYGQVVNSKGAAVNDV